jgi:hypothetical protein
LAPSFPFATPYVAYAIRYINSSLLKTHNPILR